MSNTVRAGVIDVGTHSVKLLIAEAGPGGGIRMLESLKNVVPLGRDTFLEGHITRETINRTAGILEKYGEKLKEYAVTAVKVIATTAVREAENRGVFVDTIRRRTGFGIEVLAAGDVVYYIDTHLNHTLKDTYPLHEKNLLIAELGAGSLDVSVMARGFIQMNTGLPLGVLRLRQLAGELDGSRQEVLEALVENVEAEISSLRRAFAPQTVDDIILFEESFSGYLPALTGRAAGQSFFTLSAADAQAILAQVSAREPADIAREHRIPPEAAETLAEYAAVLSGITGLSSGGTVQVFKGSLAEAVIADMILDYDVSPKYNKANQLISLADAVARKYAVDLAHTRQVAILSDALFDGCKDLLGLKKGDALYLQLAARLHDIGAFVNNRSHHKHAEYLIANLNLFRLSSEEIRIIACVARYHRRGAPGPAHPLYQSLPAERQILVQKLSAILRLANSLDRSHRQKITKLETAITRTGDIVLTAHAAGNLLLERTEFAVKKAIFEELSGSRLSLKIQLS